ncbi:MAG TPA: amidohydrolase family protein [Bryobacteraceae bacterium]|jgi:predicted TIM-barrel fold metal-dependent hydrolase|nr:amidohydrolase family protein [Bryobacteraceae bacterium]
MQRRTFLKSTLLAAAAPSAWPQSAPASAPSWGGPVIDTHLHLRRDPDACFTHMQGCGVSHAVLLTPASLEDAAQKEMEKRPGRFVRSVSYDPARPDAVTVFRAALSGGAISMGEIKYHLAIDSPEMRRLYDLSAELQVPVMMHIQDFPHFKGELPYNTGYPQFDKILKAYPKTIFIGHADLFWANISADVPADRGYPTGPIKPGGLTDRWLSDFANLHADMSANSGNNALSRDPAFSHDFVARHRNKLIFGSDCNCLDGNGGGVSQANNPEAARLEGKCVARETLATLKSVTTPEIFHQVVWENANRLFKLKLQYPLSPA